MSRSQVLPQRSKASAAPSRSGDPPLVLIHALIGIFTAVLRSVTSSLLLLISTMITAVAVVALVGFFATGLTGVVGLRLSRRRPGKPD